MGYTHYWTHTGFSAEQWAEIKRAAGTLIASSPCKLVYEYDEPRSSPHIDGASIRFNGNGENGHETFELRREQQEPTFCKTAQKPYDVVVAAILVAARYVAPGVIVVKSDGDEKDWKRGLRFAKRVLGHEVPYPCLPRHLEMVP